MYQNFRLEQPYQHVGFDAAHLTQAVSYTVDEKLKALDRASPVLDRCPQRLTFRTRTEITPANLQSHIAALFSRMHIESLVHGNVLRDEALALAKTVEDTFKPEPLTVEELKSRQALIIPEGASLSLAYSSTSKC